MSARPYMIQFSTDISLGNALTISVMIIGGIKAWTSVRTTAAVAAEKLATLTKKVEDAELEKLKVCVETMWLFQLRRGVAEVEQKQLGRVNSPMKLTEAANELMAPLLPELKRFYELANGEKMGLVELAIAMEKQFGERIATDVCRKVGITDGACLVLAIGQLRPIGPQELRLALNQCSDATRVKSIAKQLL